MAHGMQLYRCPLKVYTNGPSHYLKNKTKPKKKNPPCREGSSKVT